MKIRMPRRLPPGGELETGLSGDANPAQIRIDSQQLLKAVCEIATNAWKAKARLDSIAPEGQSPDHRRLARNVGAILDALATIQVQVKDHTGEAYDYGMPLKVVASEPRAGISREVVIETVRPTVIMGENLLQRGEVVIAVPNDEEDIQS